MSAARIRTAVAMVGAGVIVAGGLVVAGPATAEDSPPAPDPFAGWCSSNVFSIPGVPDSSPKLPPGSVINTIGPQGPGLYQCVPGVGWIKILSIPLEAPPILTPDAAMVTVDEGGTATNSGSLTWTGATPAVLTSSIGVVTDNLDGTWDWSFGFAEGPQTTTVTITATAGERIGLATFDVQVDNVAPTVTAVTPDVTTALVGDPVTFTAAATDPSSDDTTAGFTWSFDSGAGTTNPYQASFTTCGDHTVAATATDADGGTSDPVSSSAVTVTDVHLLGPLADGAETVAPRQVVPVRAEIGCSGVAPSGAEPVVELVDGSTVVATVPMRQTGGAFLGLVRLPAAPSGTELVARVRPDAAGDAALDALLTLR